MKPGGKIISSVLGLAIFAWVFSSVSGIGQIFRMAYSEESCKPAGSGNEWLAGSFTDEVMKIAAETDRFLLQDLTPFPWDELHIVSPYTTDMKIISRFGFHPRLLGCTSIYSMDDRNLLVFKKNGELAAFADIPRSIGWVDAYPLESVYNGEFWLCIRDKGEGYVVVGPCETGIGATDEMGASY